MSEPDNTPPPLADRGWYLAVEFGHSSSQNFEKALAVANKLPGFAALIDESGTCTYRAILRPDRLTHLRRLIDLIAGWRNVRFYVRGREVPVTAIEPWLNCYLYYVRRGSAPCQQPLTAENPCIQVGCSYSGISLRLSDWDSWYCRGEVEDDGLYRVRKEYLYSRIGSWQTQYAQCPFADAGLLRRVVELLPETIDLERNRHWRKQRDPYIFGRTRVTPRTLTDYEHFLRECLAPLFAGPASAGEGSPASASSQPK